MSEQMNLKEFMKLPIKKRRNILRQQAKRYMKEEMKEQKVDKR